MNDYTDRVAIVTGAASGIGLGLSLELAKRNAKVFMIDIDKERLEKTINLSPLENKEIYVADVTDSCAVNQMIKFVYEKYGRVDYLFNNAGIGGTLPFEQASLEHWNKIINLNLYGIINVLTAVYPIMKKQKYGYIINTSSIAGIIPFPGQSLYNTTKYAVTGLSLSLEKEFKKHNISISIVCPGMVKTRIFYKPILGSEASEYDVKIPKEAISVEDAVKDIMRGIEHRKRIIITPHFLKLMYLKYRLTGKI